MISGKFKKTLTVIIIYNILCFMFMQDALAESKLNFNRIMVEESIGAGLGFIGGMVTMGVYMAVAGGSNAGNLKTADYLNSYVLGSMVSSAFGVYYIGRFGGDEGKYPLALAGSLGGTLTAYLFGMGKDKSFALYAVLIPLAQSAGGVLGFNWFRIKDALISSGKKGVSIALPGIYFSRVSGDSSSLMAKVNLLKLDF